VMIVIFFLCQ